MPIKLSLLCAVLFTLVACSDKTDRTGAQPQFQVLAATDFGIDFVHHNGHDKNYRYPEIMGAGVAVLDFDNDGDLDVYFVQSDPQQADQLYQSQLIETGQLGFINVSDKLHSKQTGYGIGVAVGDYNNDGFADIFLSNWQANRLLKNVNGEYFADVTDQVGIEANDDLSIMSVFVDLNNDGWQDIISINNVNYFQTHEPQCTMMQGPDYCGPSSYSYLPNTIWHNQSGIFRTVPAEHSGLSLALPSLAMTVWDINADGRLDFYIANDEKVNTLWINQGEFQFTETALTSGLAVNAMAKTEASMGIGIGDINQDGRLDVYLTHMWQETNTLYMQNAEAQFTDETNRYGLAQPSYVHTGFGTAMSDFDNDGDLDIVVANGSIMRNSQHNYNEPNAFYQNKGEQFMLMDNSLFLSSNPQHSSRGLVAADLDNDGDEDFIISNNNAGAEIYLNQNNNLNHNNWIGYTAYLESQQLAENIESMVEYNHALIANIQSRAGSYASSSDPRVLMGLGKYNGTIDITLRWNPDEFEQFKQLQANHYHKLVKGQGLTVLAWPNAASSQVQMPIENSQQLRISIDSLLADKLIAETIKSHINGLITEQTSLELCLTLQSYEYSNQASFCYADYFSNNNATTADSYYLAAINEANRFAYTKAQQYFAKSLVQQPKNWLVCFRKAQTYFQQNDFAAARVQLNGCEKLNEDVNNLKLSGDIYLAQKQPKQAFAAYREVLKQQPTATHVYYQMAESLEGFASQDMVNLALAQAGNKKLKLNDTILAGLVAYNKNAEFHYEKSLLAHINQDLETAVNAMARAYELQPNAEKIFRNYALMLLQTQQSQAALNILLKHQNEFTEVESFLLLGSILTKINQRQTAQQVYAQGLLSHADNIALLTNSANNYLRMNELESAKLNYTKILEIEPDNANAKAGLQQSN